MTCDQQFEELMIRLNKAEARVIELESDKYVNNIKADAFEEGFRYSCGVYNGGSSKDVITTAIQIYKEVLSNG